MTKPVAALVSVEAAIAETIALQSKGLQEPPRQAQSSADAVTAHCTSILDRATQDALARLDSLIAQAQKMRASILDHSDRMNAEIQSFIRITVAASAASDHFEAQLQDMRADHADLVKP